MILSFASSFFIKLMLSPIGHKEEHIIIIGNIIDKNELDGHDAVKSFEGTWTTFQSLKLDVKREMWSADCATN